MVVIEQSGELEQMLDRIATAYDEEIEVARAFRASSTRS